MRSGLHAHLAFAADIQAARCDDRPELRPNLRRSATGCRLAGRQRAVAKLRLRCSKLGDAALDCWGPFMREFRWLAAVMALAVLGVGTAAQAGGIAHAFVSSHGTDAAGCGASETPCRSFQYVIDNIVAPGGEITVLDSAGYGAVTITKSLTITNPGGVEAGIIAPSGQNAVTINATS